MRKVASPADLQQRLAEIKAGIQTSANPSRNEVANQLRQLAADLIPKQAAAAPFKLRPIKPESLGPALLKMRKDAWSAFSLGQVFSIMEELGGWTFSTDITPEFGGPHHYEFFQSKEEAEKTRKDFLSTKKDPFKLAKGERCYTDISEVKEAGAGAREPWYFECTRWFGQERVKVTAPNGNAYMIAELYPSDALKTTAQLVSGFAADASLSDIAKSRGPWFREWVNTKTPFLTQVAAKLSMPTLEAEKEQKVKQKSESTSGQGICPACFGPFKLTRACRHGSDKTMPGMVLHGYSRPGTGYIIGNCRGQDWPPFELSCEGTIAHVKWLEASKDQYEMEIQRHKSKDVDNIERNVYAHGRYRVETVMRSEVSAEEWEKLVERAIAQLGVAHSYVLADIKKCSKLISTWEPKPLKA